MTFTVTYADTSDRRIVRRETVDADDLDEAAADAIRTCPSSWFVVRVEQTDVFVDEALVGLVRGTAADDNQQAIDENDEQRDYAEERYNAALLREE